MNRAPLRILLIYPYPSIDSNPTISLLLETLTKNGLRADVLLPKNDAFLLANTYGDTIDMGYVPQGYFSQHATCGSKEQFLKLRLKCVLQSLLRPPYSFATAASVDFGWFAPIRGYSAIIGIDPFGITTAARMNKWAKKPLIYISFELIFHDELSSAEEYSLEQLERAACLTASLIVIQDDERANVFCGEKSVRADRIITIPVAPSPDDVRKSDYLRAKLNISGQKRIVLFIGELETWASRDELGEMVSHWPNDFCLVVHSRSNMDCKKKQYIESLEKTGKVYVTTHPVPRKELANLVASADYGLAPYKPVPDAWWTCKNIYHLGFSSGKVAYYALCGLPILARSLPVFEREFSTYQCGKVYTHVAETGSMLEALDQNYSFHSTQAKKFYQERLNPTTKIQMLVDDIIQLSRTGTLSRFS